MSTACWARIKVRTMSASAARIDRSYEKSGRTPARFVMVPQADLHSGWSQCPKSRQVQAPGHTQADTRPRKVKRGLAAPFDTLRRERHFRHEARPLAATLA